MSDNEDYMSNNYVNSKIDNRPGLVPNKIARLYKQEFKQKEHNKWQKQKSRHVLEAEYRKQGLESAIGKDNKGFQLLQKMGYKPNTGIGKHGNGRIEPVPIDLKQSREGMGKEADKKRQNEMMQKITAAKKVKVEKEWKESIKTKLSDKETIKDLNKSQKACEQLDSRTGISEPAEKFYWPKALLKTKDDDHSEDLDDNDDDDENNSDDNSISNTDQLQKLTDYLRSKYFYCIWCAIEYNDCDDMKSNCPGSSSTDHGND